MCTNVSKERPAVIFKVEGLLRSTMFLRNTRIYIPGYMASHPRRPRVDMVSARIFQFTSEVQRDDAWGTLAVAIPSHRKGKVMPV
jgi:hypothetical protein